LEKLRLVSILSPLGKVNYRGSYHTGLMTWPDIDIHVEGQITDDQFFQVVQSLFKKRTQVKSLHVADYRLGENPNYPMGLYLGMKCIGEQFKEWKIDVWFVADDSEHTFDEWLIKNLTPEKKQQILEIKNVVADHPKYRKEILSVDIYKAVIEHAVSNLEEFKSYLHTVGKSL
ncbi:MAG TPA: hypothetical protein PLD54_04295, partial [Candidatus Levybacteria bacterium]|nr:hypothetical protein [Candidatus Levybacteria bacterium]